MNILIGLALAIATVYIIITILRLFHWHRFGVCARVLHEYFIQISKFQDDHAYFKGLDSEQIDIVKALSVYYAALVKAADSRNQFNLVREEMEKFIESITQHLGKNQYLDICLYQLTINLAGIVGCTSFFAWHLMLRLNNPDLTSFIDTVYRWINIARINMSLYENHQPPGPLPTPFEIQNHPEFRNWENIHVSVVDMTGKYAA